MPRYNGNQPDTFEKINYMTLEQQAQVRKLIEEIEAADKLTIPRIIMTDDDNACWMRSKNDKNYWISKLGTSPVKAFVDYMRAEKKLLIGEPTAEKVVESIGSVLPLPQEVTFVVKGRSLESGLPATIEISSIQVRDVLLNKTFNKDFLASLQHSMNYAPSRHMISQEQLAQAQIVLRGTLRYIRGLDQRLKETTGLKVILDEYVI